jgi:hypothetical protein
VPAAQFLSLLQNDMLQDMLVAYVPERRVITVLRLGVPVCGHPTIVHGERAVVAGVLPSGMCWRPSRNARAGVVPLRVACVHARRPGPTPHATRHNAHTRVRLRLQAA